MNSTTPERSEDTGHGTRSRHSGATTLGKLELVFIALIAEAYIQLVWSLL